MKTKINSLCKLTCTAILLLTTALACGGNIEPSNGINTANSTEEIVAIEGISTSETEPTVTEISQTQTPELSEPTPVLVSTETPLPTVTLEPDQVKVEMGNLNEFGGYSFAAVSVKDPAEPGLFYEPQEGMRLIAVELIVGNVSGETFSSNLLNTVLVDADGLTYLPELGAVDDQLELIEVQPGERVSGLVPFAIPNESIPAVVKYDFSEFPEIELESSLSPAGQDNVSVLDVPLTKGGDSSQQRAPMGEVVEQDGYSLVAEALEDPATPSEFYDPQAGEKLVAVQIVVGNESGEEFSSNVLSAFLIDDRGFLYPAELGGRDEQLELVDLAHGERVRGWVSFSIPEGSVPSALKFQFSGYPFVELYTGLSASEVQSVAQVPTETSSAEAESTETLTPEADADTVLADQIIGTWSGLQTSSNGEKIPAEWQFLEGGVMVVRIPAVGISYGATWNLEGTRLHIITEVDPDNPTYRDVEFITDDVMRLTKAESNIIETWTKVLE